MSNPTPKSKSESQISVIDDSPTTESMAAPATPTVAHDAAMSGRMEAVTIHSGQEDGGSDAVFIGHNGYAYQIPRDKPFTVPTEVAQILRDSVVTSYKAGAGGTFTERKTPRYAFSAVAV
jgi:hypothetical protein